MFAQSAKKMDFYSCCSYFVLLSICEITLVKTQDEEQIEYYTNLVEDGIKDALNYELPISADEYRPINARIKGNYLKNKIP